MALTTAYKGSGGRSPGGGAEAFRQLREFLAGAAGAEYCGQQYSQCL